MGIKLQQVKYISTSEYTASEDDYEQINLRKIIFKPNETTKTIEISTDEDDKTETEEYFYVDLFKRKADAARDNRHASCTVYIKNSNVTDQYKYTITNNTTYQNPVEEGQNVRITIDRQDSNGNQATASKVYISTSEYTASEDDYEQINLRKIIFKPNETTKTIEISTYEDDETETEEYFYVDLFKHKADAAIYNSHASCIVYIKNKISDNIYICGEAKQGKGVNERCNQKKHKKKKNVRKVYSVNIRITYQKGKEHVRHQRIITILILLLRMLIQ